MTSRQVTGAEAKLIKERRLERGYSIKRAAAMCGMSKDTWKKAEEAGLIRELSFQKIQATLGAIKPVLAPSDPLEGFLILWDHMTCTRPHCFWRSGMRTQVTLRALIRRAEKHREKCQ